MGACPAGGPSLRFSGRAQDARTDLDRGLRFRERLSAAGLGDGCRPSQVPTSLQSAATTWHGETCPQGQPWPRPSSLHHPLHGRCGQSATNHRVASQCPGGPSKEVPGGWGRWPTAQRPRMSPGPLLWPGGCGRRRLASAVSPHAGPHAGPCGHGTSWPSVLALGGRSRLWEGLSLEDLVT